MQNSKNSVQANNNEFINVTHVERGNRWSDFYAPERQGSHPPFVLIILHNRCDMTWRMWPEISATRRKDKVSSQHGLFNSFASILKWLIRCAKCWHAIFYSSEVVRVSSELYGFWGGQMKLIVIQTDEINYKNNYFSPSTTEIFFNIRATPWIL